MKKISFAVPVITERGERGEGSGGEGGCEAV